jgi:glycosyltransferase involved in cell wall biosynthesis/multidrug transporter EmrE-like cation transporter
VRILVVTSYPPRHCGIGAYARDQVERFRAEGHLVTVLTAPDGHGDRTAHLLGGSAFLKAARMGGRFDRIVVHFQPALYYRPRRPVSKVLTSLAFLMLALARGRKLDILVHEADTPKRWRPDYVLLRAVFRLAGRTSFHTEAERATFEREYRVKVNAQLVSHAVATRRKATRQEARDLLGLQADGYPIFVCAGFLQPSKGFDRAVEAFAATGLNGGRLYIVGSVREPTPENLAFARVLSERAGSVPGVMLIDRFVSDEEFDLWVAAADRIVLPYRRSLSSGILARAHALGTPAIVSAVGGLAEQASEQDVVVHDDVELAGALRAGAVPPADPGERRHRHGAGAGPETDWDPEVETVISSRKARLVLIGLILVSVALAAVAQLTLKHGMNQVTNHGDVPLDLGRPVDTLHRVAANLSVWAGLATFVLSAAVWLIVLSKASLSFAYPFASLTYVLILVFDRFVLREPISGLRYGGVALIIAGLLLISRTHQTA